MNEKDDSRKRLESEIAEAIKNPTVSNETLAGIYDALRGIDVHTCFGCNLITPDIVKVKIDKWNMDEYFCRDCVFYCSMCNQDYTEWTRYLHKRCQDELAREEYYAS